MKLGQLIEYSKTPKISPWVYKSKLRNAWTYTLGENSC